MGEVVLTLAVDVVGDVVTALVTYDVAGEVVVTS